MKDPYRAPRSNPLDLEFWLLGIDAREGDLEACGYEKRRHPEGLGSSLYVRGGLGLHSMGLWLDEPDGRLLYSRPDDRFYWIQRRPPRTTSPAEAPKASLPPTPPPGSTPIPFQEGLARIQAAVLTHEEEMSRQRGADYRRGLLAGLPRGQQRGRGAWEAAFGQALSA